MSPIIRSACQSEPEQDFGPEDTQAVIILLLQDVPEPKPRKPIPQLSVSVGEVLLEA